MYSTFELDPCMFCNGSMDDGELSALNKSVLNETVWFVKCVRCGATGPEKGSRQEAVDAWNTKHQFRLRRDGMEWIRIVNNNDPMEIAKDAFIMTAIFGLRYEVDLTKPLEPGELFVKDSTGKMVVFYLMEFYDCACGRKQPKYAPGKQGISEKAAEAVGWRKIDGQWRCPFCCNSTDALFNLFEKDEEKKDLEDPEEL